MMPACHNEHVLLHLHMVNSLRETAQVGCYCSSVDAISASRQVPPPYICRRDRLSVPLPVEWHGTINCIYSCHVVSTQPTRQALCEIVTQWKWWARWARKLYPNILCLSPPPPNIIKFICAQHQINCGGHLNWGRGGTGPLANWNCLFLDWE